MTYRCEHVFTSAHAELLRAAYVTLAGHRSREGRWAQAHRIVAASLPLRSASVPADSEEKVYLRLLARVLRRAIKPPPLAGLLSWLKAATPGGGQSQATIDEALARLPPPARAAYYLYVAEERLPAQIAALLRSCGASAVNEAIRQARQLSAALEHGEGITVEEQRQVLVSVAMTPKAAWLPAPDPLAIRAKRLARWGAAAGTAAILAFAAVPERRTVRLVDAGPVIPASKVDADTWRKSGRASIRVWPTRGSLLGDATLILDATRAWAAADPQLLYAGDATGKPVVLLTDGNRIARYSPGDPLDVSSLSSEDIRGSSVLRLGDGYYLAAPWVSGLEAGPIGTAGRTLTLGEGIAGPVAPGGDCRHITVLRVSVDGILPREPFTLGDTGFVQPSHLMYIPPVIAGTVQRPHEQDFQGGPEAFAAAGCRLASLTTKPLRSLTIWEFQRASLPDGVTGRWLCARADRIDGGSAVSVLLATNDPTGTKQLFDGSGNRLCSRQEHHLAVGTWWSGEHGWHYLGAASRAVGQLSITAGGQSKSGRGTVSLGPFATPVGGATVTATRDGGAVPAITAQAVP